MGQKKSKSTSSTIHLKSSNNSHPTTPVSAVPSTPASFENNNATKFEKTPSPAPILSKDSAQKELEEIYDKFRKIDNRDDTPENDFISVCTSNNKKY